MEMNDIYNLSYDVLSQINDCSSEHLQYGLFYIIKVKYTVEGKKYSETISVKHNEHITIDALEVFMENEALHSEAVITKYDVARKILFLGKKKDRFSFLEGYTNLITMYEHHVLPRCEKQIIMLKQELDAIRNMDEKTIVKIKDVY